MRKLSEGKYVLHAHPHRPLADLNQKGSLKKAVAGTCGLDASLLREVGTSAVMEAQFRLGEKVDLRKSKRQIATVCNLGQSIDGIPVRGNSVTVVCQPDTNELRSIKAEWCRLTIAEDGKAGKPRRRFLHSKQAVDIAIARLLRQFPRATKNDMVLTSCREEFLVLGNTVRPILMCEFNGVYALYVDLEDGRIHNAE